VVRQNPQQVFIPAATDNHRATPPTNSDEIMFLRKPGTSE